MPDALPNSTAFSRWRAATLAPFGERVFAVFWVASLVSSFGSMIQTVAASWLMTTLSPSSAMIALVQTASTLPFFLFSLAAGALGDIYDRRRIMLVSQLVMLTVAAVLAYVTWIGALTPWMLLGFTFLTGCGAAVYSPVWQSSISEQVPRHSIASAVAANALGFNVARSTGPALGGILVAAAGATIAFAINAVSYVGLIVTLLWWKAATPKPSLPPEPLAAAIGSGLRYIRLSPPLLAILTRCFAFTLAASAMQALLPIVSRDLLGGGAPTYGVMLGGFGIGAMGGAVTSAIFRARYSSEAILRGVSAGSCVAAVAVGLSTWPAVSFFFYAIAGAIWMLGMSSINIAVQLSSPRWVTGRTVASYQTIAFGGFALGSWLWGELAHRFGVRASMCAAGAAALVSLLIARRVRVRVPQLDGLDPHAGASITAPQLALRPTAGPIVVTVEYHVAAANAATFISVINELGRIRRRDGARDWSISQDIDQPQIWTERFESPTWLEHLRRQTRPTKSDQRVRDHVALLVEGGHGSVRRAIGRPPGSDPVGMIATDPIVASALPMQH